MNPRIVIIGSTGKLGLKLLNYSKTNNVKIFCLTCFKNRKLLESQANKHNVRHTFILSDPDYNNDFKLFLHNNRIDIIYFLDYGFKSIVYADIFLKKNRNSQIAIANKEMIIAGGSALINKIIKTKNKLIPLDSEHFSLINNNIKNEYVKKIYITASGGPFYYKKNVNLDKVKLKNVLAHPKWKMGLNNSIDSSNFINKILEIYELSIIYNISLQNIDFLISQEAYIHSVVIYNDNTLSINCFENDMLIPLIKPLKKYYNYLSLNNSNKKFLNNKYLKIEKFDDKRFKINKYFNILKNLSNNKQIYFLILNNIAQKKYLSGEIKYNQIIDYIMFNLKKININKNIKFKSLNDRIKFINSVKL